MMNIQQLKILSISRISNELTRLFIENKFDGYLATKIKDSRIEFLITVYVGNDDIKYGIVQSFAEHEIIVLTRSMCDHTAYLMIDELKNAIASGNKPN